MLRESVKPEERGRENLRILLIFVFFIAGAAGAGRAPDWLKEGALSVFPMAALSALSLCLAMFMAASFAGAEMIPVCAAAVGLLAGCCSEGLVNAHLAGEALDIRLLLAEVIAVPAFFLIGVNGMKLSSSLAALLRHQGPGARAEYYREYMPLVLSAAAVMLALYFTASG